MKKRIITLLLVTAMILTGLVPAAQAETAQQPDPATTGKNAPLDFVTSTSQVCPVCGGSAKTWKPLPTGLTKNTALDKNGHYYVPEGGVSNNYRFLTSNGGNVCIHLNNSSINAGAIMFNMTNGTKLNIFGSGTVNGKAGNAGCIAAINTATVNLYGGTYTANASAGSMFALLSSASNFNVYDGATITGGRGESAGANVNMSNGTFKMYGGIIAGGSATGSGGNIYVAKGTFTMSGGTVSGGSATNGGNLYLAPNAKFTMTGGTISGGNATTSGGNIYAEGCAFTVSGSILDGTAGTTGGNISAVSGANLTVAGTVARGSVSGTTSSDWGGNIRAWHATVNVEAGAQIYGGSGGGKPGAANIGCLGEDTSYPTALNINGGTVVGNIHTSAPAGDFAGTAVKITGAPSIVKTLVIDGTTYTSRQGLFIQQGCVIDISGMTGGSVCLSGENGQAMTAAYENASILTGCFNAFSSSQQVDLTDNVFYMAEKQASGDGSGDFAPWENDEKAVCPICGEEKTWTPYSGTGTIGEQADGAHVYLYGDLNATGRNQVLSAKENATVCFNLNGCTLSMDGRIAIARAGATLNIMDTSSAHTGLVTSTGTRTESTLYNYTIVNQNNGTINLYGGTYRNTNADFAVVRCSVASAKINVYDGAVIDGNSQTRSVYMLGGKFTVNGGMIKNGTSAANGGNIYMEAGTLTIKGGTVFGGSAVNGGNLYATGGTVTIAGDGDENTAAPQFIGGTATTNGGNIALVGTSSSAKVNCSIGEGALISGGNAKEGGSVHMSNATVNLTDGEVSGGTASSRGGCFNVGSAAMLNISGGTVSGGSTSGNGGNIYTSSTNSNINMTGGTVTEGVSQNSGTSNGGGNIYLNNGNLDMKGGTISNGSAPNAYGGNIYARAGIYSTSNKATLDDDGNPDTPKPLITGGTAKNTGGNIYIEKYLTLGDCEITNGDSVNYNYGDDLSVKHGGKLTVKTNFAGQCDLYIATCCMPVVTIGGKVDETAGAAEGPFPGRLILEQYSKKPVLVGREGDTGLYISESALVHKDGTYSWFADNASMMAAYDDTVAYIRACEGEMVLDGGEYVVDLLGKNVNFTGSGSVTCFDSANDTYKTYGTATFDGVTLVNTKVVEANGKNYYSLSDNGVYSFHRFNQVLSSVSLRPSAGGIYYTAKWESDDVLMEAIEGFGVAVSVKQTPENNFFSDGHSLYSTFEKDEFQCGVRKTGVMISGILKDNSEERISYNAEYAQMKIYAAAYLCIDGVNYMSSGMAHSLQDVLSIIHDNKDAYADDAASLQSFMGKWSALGLSGEPWSGYTFDVSEDVYHLNRLYAGRNPYQGEFHDHADTGGKSDGKVTLDKIKEVMAARDIDFTTILDHFQILHMELEEWDNSLFIGGSEMSTIIHDKKITKNSIHVNMIFSDPESFKDLMALHNPGGKYAGGKFTFHLDEASGNEYYDEHQWSAAEFTQLIEDIRACGGMYVFPHPKDGTRYVSDNPEDYWFADWTGLEVFYGPSYYAPTGQRTKDAYQLWKDLLKLGKRMWATAGSDSHSLPNTNALTTIYSEAKDAAAYLNHAKDGDMTCGPVGIQMCVGDTLMGGETDFTGNRLVLRISDFHSTVVFAGHSYKMELIGGNSDGETVLHTDAIDPAKPYYYAVDTDDTYDYYRVAVYDESDTRLDAGMPIALGNPIWNIQES